MSVCRTRRWPLKTYWHVATAALLTVAGCGGPHRLPLAGNVTVGGVPVYRGSINFTRASGEGPSAGAGIAEGVFTLSADHGLEPGEYRATVQALTRTGNTAQDPLRGAVEEVVPILLADPVVAIAISADNAQRLSFDLAEKP